MFLLCLTNYDSQFKIDHFSDLERILLTKKALFRNILCLECTVKYFQHNPFLLVEIPANLPHWFGPFTKNRSTPFLELIVMLQRSKSWDNSHSQLLSQLPSLCFFICHPFLSPFTFTFFVLNIFKDLIFKVSCISFSFKNCRVLLPLLHSPFYLLKLIHSLLD